MLKFNNVSLNDSLKHDSIKVAPGGCCCCCTCSCCCCVTVNNISGDNNTINTNN
ncbi:streptolysin S family bacteriocin [Clostridiaceae bacterium M8S5]|nr:streptolysin S family bacteriocin [Clostridiaceae bacterium M8S5]